MNVNEIYKVNKFVVCLQRRKDKAILDVLKQYNVCAYSILYISLNTCLLVTDQLI